MSDLELDIENFDDGGVEKPKGVKPSLQDQSKFSQNKAFQSKDKSHDSEQAQSVDKQVAQESQDSNLLSDENVQ